MNDSKFSFVDDVENNSPNLLSLENDRLFVAENEYPWNDLLFLPVLKINSSWCMLKQLFVIRYLSVTIAFRFSKDILWARPGVPELIHKHDCPEDASDCICDCSGLFSLLYQTLTPFFNLNIAISSQAAISTLQNGAKSEFLSNIHSQITHDIWHHLANSAVIDSFEPARDCKEWVGIVVVVVKIVT